MYIPLAVLRGTKWFPGAIHVCWLWHRKPYSAAVPQAGRGWKGNCITSGTAAQLKGPPSQAGVGRTEKQQNPAGRRAWSAGLETVQVLQTDLSNSLKQHSSSSSLCLFQEPDKQPWDAGNIPALLGGLQVSGKGSDRIHQIASWIRGWTGIHRQSHSRPFLVKFGKWQPPWPGIPI